MEDRKWGSSGPSPRVAQVTSAYIHPIDTDSLPWPQLQRSWDLWLSCVPERKLMGNAKHHPLQRAGVGRGQHVSRAKGAPAWQRESMQPPAARMRSGGALPRVRAPSSFCTGREGVSRAVTAAALEEPPEQRPFVMGTACAEGRRPPPPPPPRPRTPEFSSAASRCSRELIANVPAGSAPEHRLSAPCFLQGNGHGCRWCVWTPGKGRPAVPLFAAPGPAGGPASP